VLKAMRGMPINDMMTKNGAVREDGRVLRDLFIVEVKKPGESSGDRFSSSEMGPLARPTTTLSPKLISMKRNKSPVIFQAPFSGRS
jgi:hypothetical protein